VRSDARHQFGPNALDACQRSEGTEGAVFVAVADDAFGKRGTHTREELELCGGRAVDIDNDNAVRALAGGVR
jgi:hypothetical protein